MHVVMQTILVNILVGWVLIHGNLILNISGPMNLNLFQKFPKIFSSTVMYRTSGFEKKTMLES